LVLFLETILSRKIDVERLKRVEIFLIEFVSELESLYTTSIMLSGVHELLHLTDCTIDIGPLNSTNCFQYEEMNRKLLRIIYGNDLIGEEIIKIFLGMQILSSYSNSTLNLKLKHYIETRELFKTSNKKRIRHLAEDLIVMKKVIPSTNFQYLEAFSKFIGSPITEISISDKVVFNDIPYSSHYNKTKRCDACFISKKNGMIGLIECFLVYDNSVYVLAKRIASLFNSFYAPACPEIRSSMSYCSISNQLFIEDLKNITKAVYIQSSNEHFFVSFFKSSHLFS